jgi:hypothetical protein
MAFTGALMHLLVNSGDRGVLSDAITIVPNRANECEVVDIPANRHLIPARSGDFYLPDYLLIDLNRHLAMNTRDNARDNISIAKDIIRNYDLIIRIGPGIDGQGHYPLQLLEYLEPSSIIANNILKIPINYNYFMSNNNRGLPVICLALHEVYISIISNIDNTFLEGVRLVHKNMYLDSPERRALALTISSGRDYKSKIVKTFNIISTTEETAIQVLNPQGIINGIVLKLETNTNESTAIENIQNIDILLNNRIRQSYTSEIINIYCQRLAQDAVYIPINLDTDLRSEFNSNALNLSRFNNFAIRIRTNLNQGFNAKVFMINPNLFWCISGMGGFRVQIENPIIQYGLEPIPVVLPYRNTNINNTVNTNWTVCTLDFEVPQSTICPIAYDIINISEGVCKCSQCNNIFGYMAFRKWITTNYKCPICRNANIQYKYYTPNSSEVIYPNSTNNSDNNTSNTANTPINVDFTGIIPQVNAYANDGLHGEEPIYFENNH